MRSRRAAWGASRRVVALARRLFEPRPPAGLDVDLRPQARQAVEAVLGEPRLELALGLDLLLQGPQRLQARAEVRLLRGLGVDLLLPGAALVVERRHLLGELVQPRIG